jgi:hypothetical protein
MSKPATCPQCGKQFVPWRAKKFCSERCRKKAQNRRLGGMKCPSATTLPPGKNAPFFTKENQTLTDPFRRYERFSWTACNEVTRKLTREGSSTAIGWAMMVEGKGWYGRVRDGRGDWSFGPAPLNRALKAVEARIDHAPFEPQDNERMWRGDAMAVVAGVVKACGNTAERGESLVETSKTRVHEESTDESMVPATALLE